MESRLQIARDCFVIQDLPFREVLSTDFQRPLLAAIRLPTSIHLSRIGVRCTTDSSHSNLESRLPHTAGWQNTPNRNATSSVRRAASRRSWSKKRARAFPEKLSEHLKVFASQTQITPNANALQTMLDSNQRIPALLAPNAF